MLCPSALFLWPQACEVGTVLIPFYWRRSWELGALRSLFKFASLGVVEIFSLSYIALLGWKESSFKKQVPKSQIGICLKVVDWKDVFIFVPSLNPKRNQE